MSWILTFLGSSVGKKIVMAVTGAILFLFVIERILLGAPPAPASHH